MIAVVKADAYGHGAVNISKALIEGGAATLAVAFVSEARALREAGIEKTPLLVLFDRSEIPAFFDLELMPVIHDLKTAQEFSREAVRRNVTLPVHLKVDTGMGRMGIENPSHITEVKKLPGLEIISLMSHLSDADLADPACSHRQVEQFNAMAKEHFPEGISRHMANSAAVLACPEAHMDAVRPGLALYGASPFDKNRKGIVLLDSLEPAMSVSARILTIRRIPKGGTVSYARTFTAKRDTLIAVLACGYADGYNRALSNKAEVIVRGQRAPVAGRVCMDLTMVDVTDVEGVTQGDKAILLGTDGNESISANQLAGLAGTIPYEILTSLGGSASRVYN